jgi:GNAT superfamily N-acetyltransferase
MIIKIRLATVEDAEQIARLFMRAWHISLKDIVPDGFLDQFSHEKQKEKYIQRVADPEYILLVAELNGDIVGMIGAKDNHTESLSYQKEIRAMYVDPDFQRQNIGSLLLERMFLELKKSQPRNAMLWCIKANKTAGSFYEKHGGKRIETNIKPPAEYSAIPHVIYGWEFCD